MPESRGSRAGVDDGFTALRTLLVGPEQRELDELQARFRDPAVLTHDVSRVLPDSIAIRAGDPQLSRALAPLVEESITWSVRKDPQPLADALFPVMAPAIRRAIRHTLAAMMESFSRSVEQTISWGALRWRWIAWKTGRPFAEIVLLHTLQYRVEQVFLIHAETGLVLQHVEREPGIGQDPDQVSAMLTAIQDFVRDSFRVGVSESLGSLRVGELAVFIEPGPYASVAGVVRGTAPPAVRRMFEETVESIHRQLGAELRAFRGDAEPFERVRGTLEACLVTELREPSKPRSYRGWMVAAAIVLLAAAAWLVADARQERRWNAYVDRLNAEPGIVVTSSGRRDGRFFVAGLRDPLAPDPGSLVSAFALPPDRVEGRWTPYQALHTDFVTTRSIDLLRPPAGVTLAYHDGLLTASGAAPARWIVDSERIAPALAGVRRFEYAGRDPEVRLKEQLEAVTPIFVKGKASLAPAQDPAVRRIRDLLVELNETARARGKRIGVEVRGHTDSDGSDVLNGPLSESRARALLDAISVERLDALDISTRGVRSSEPLTAGITEDEKQRNRRASVRVRTEPDSSRGSAVR